MLSRIFTLGLLLLLLSNCKDKKNASENNKVNKKPNQEIISEVPAKPAFLDIEKTPIDKTPLELLPQKIQLQNGESFELLLPKDFEIYPAAEGLPRVRFFAKAPDGRLFVTGMYNLTDNKRGKVYILDDFNPRTMRFATVHAWKENLRNPNSVQFFKDKDGKDWLYLAVTDSLVRYPYTAGEMAPSGAPQKLMDFPGQGLSYKYGGWHLTRTIAIHEDKIYVSVGSSCNLCEENPAEESRATIMVMNPDGSGAKVFARGVRNAVDIGWVEGKLYATNMAADHLGWEKPNDHFYQIEEGKHYGWPYCYEHDGQVMEEDPKHQSDNRVAGRVVKDQWERKSIDCSEVPRAYSVFEPHGSPLGFAYFSNNMSSTAIRNYFLAGLHGPTKPKADMKIGHQIVRFKKGHPPEPVIDGFFNAGKQYGRPCDIIPWGDHGFFFSDDHKGVVYYVKFK